MVMAQCPLEPIHKTITSQFVSSPKAGVSIITPGGQNGPVRDSNLMHYTAFENVKNKNRKCLQAYSFLGFMAFSTDKVLPHDKSE